MNIVREEIRTGLLVVVSLAAFGALLVYLAAPGMLHTVKFYNIYFDDAGGIQIGAPVTIAGRRVGQVVHLRSPVPEAERPKPNLEAIVEVEINAGARLFSDSRATMLQYGLLGEQVINFSGGAESAGLATAKTKFIGERQPGLNEATPKVLEQLEPVSKSACRTLEELRKTAERMNALLSRDADLAVTLGNFKAVSENLIDMSGSNGSLRHTLQNLEDMTGDESPLSQALRNASQFTAQLADNKDLPEALQNFRKASRNLNTTVTGLRGTIREIEPGVQRTMHNTVEFTDTIKHQPWRLIWPTTKKYPEDKPSPTPAPVAEKKHRVKPPYVSK